MPDTSNTERVPDPSDETTGATTTEPPPTGRARRALPVGPLGMLLITALALAAAFGAAALAQDLLSDDGVVDVQDALDGSAAAPLVGDTSVRAEIGSPAPDVRLEYLDGGVQQLAEVAGVGTPVVLNFWSSTCVPCLNEMPAFEEVRARFADDVTIVGIDVADTEEAGQAMVERTGVRYRNARDPRSQIFSVFGGIALPRTVVIGGDGIVLDTHTGELDAEELTDLLRRHDLVTT
jgi:thiol-disulfide isomerase/thioredoxin